MGSTFSGFNCWLINQLLLDLLQDNRLISRREKTQMFFGLGRIFNLKWQILFPVNAQTSQKAASDPHESVAELGRPIV